MYRYAIFAVIMVLVGAGCQNGRKTGLTEAELRRITTMNDIELAESAGNLILVVAGEQINSEEIINTPANIERYTISPVEYFETTAKILSLELFKQRARETIKEIVTNRISNIVLYQYARQQAGDGIDEALEEEARFRYQELALSYGNNQALIDEVLEESDFDKNSYIEYQKRFLLIQWYLGTKLNDDRPVTYRQLQQRYEQMKYDNFIIDAMIQFRLIDIQPERLAVTEPNAVPEQLAAEILAKIDAGEDFGQLAREYSHGSMRESNGLWPAIDPDPESLAPPYDNLANAARTMEPGDITEVTTEGHIFIMKLESKQIAGFEPLEKVQIDVEQALLDDRENEAINSINERIDEQTKLGQTDEFVDFCLDKLYQMCNSEQEETSQ